MKTKARSAKRGRLSLTWLGHSAFSMTSPQGRVVVVDPWLENPNAPPGAKDLPRVDLILVTHGHSDHLGNTVELARRTGARVAAVFELAGYLQSRGISAAISMNKGGSVDVDGIRVSMVDAKHTSSIDAGGATLTGGEAVGFVIRFEDGFTVYHAGDTALFSDMKLIGQLYKPDLALLPIGDLYTMGPPEAAKACELINPKRIVGMHYGTFPVLTGTPAALRKLLPPRLRSRLTELVPGMPAAF